MNDLAQIGHKLKFAIRWVLKKHLPYHNDIRRAVQKKWKMEEPAIHRFWAVAQEVAIFFIYHVERADQYAGDEGNHSPDV